MSPASLFEFTLGDCALEASGLLDVGPGFGSQAIFDFTKSCSPLKNQISKRQTLSCTVKLKHPSVDKKGQNIKT